MLYLGLDIGSSSVKGSLLDSKTGDIIRRVRYPEDDLIIDSPAAGMAEQNPEEWWNGVKQVISGLTSGIPSGRGISGIGIIYQMHGLVCVDESLNVLRPAIIWCDSRAIKYGKNINQDLHSDLINEHTLNPPSNLTAAKLAWVKEHEPELYKKIYKILLPGDFIAMKFSGECQTTISGLSEMALWDFKKHDISHEVMAYFGFSRDILPEICENMEVQCRINDKIAAELHLPKDTPISFRAGDQIGNAFAVNVNAPGEAVCNAGTSGVIYGLSSRMRGDEAGRFNTIAHIGHQQKDPKLGYLLCINGCGILYSWLKRYYFSNHSFNELNLLAEEVPCGADDLKVIPYGNGAERSLYNKIFGAHFSNIDFNRHDPRHLLRASIEGIAFSLRYGMEVLEDQAISFKRLKASYANLMLNDVFSQTLSDISGLPIVCLKTEGSDGAARGAAIGVGESSSEEIFESLSPQSIIEPKPNIPLQEVYEEWKELINKLS